MVTTPEPLPDTPEASALRHRLVASLVEMGDIQDERVRRVLLQVPRHLFVPRWAPLEEAYANRPLRIGHGQTISQPAIVARMTEALQLSGQDRVLEIGTGSGYQAAILSALAREVYTIEIFEELAASAAAHLRKLGCWNVHVRQGDGAAGWASRAPFDRILATAAAPSIPMAWFEQLADGGILVAPVGEEDGEQRLLRFRKRGGDTKVDDLGAVAFVPILPPP